MLELSSNAGEIERIAFEAVGAATKIELDGWILRHDPGSPVRRRNSVLPLQHLGTRSLQQKIRAAEDFYRSRDLPPRFQVSRFSEPQTLERALLQAGYVQEALTWVMTKELTEPCSASHHQVRIEELPDEAWIRTAKAVSGGFCQAPSPGASVAYGSLEFGREVLSVGIGFLQGPWLGIFGMGTLPRARGLGFAACVLQEICSWGHIRGALRAYLQVEDANSPAQRLYFKQGFDRSHPYCYWTKLR